MSRSSLETSSSAGSPVAEASTAARTAAGRRRHTHVAAQACETCRTRKTRCDEQRPRCGLCERLDLLCVYREPRPTKKDKTQTDILATVKRIDAKVDRILEQSPENLRQLKFPLLQQQQTDGLTATVDVDGLAGHPSGTHSAYFSESHDLRGALSVFPWPAIQALVRKAGGRLSSDLEQIMRWGSAWLVREEILSASNPLPTTPMHRKSTLYIATENDGESRTVFPDLTPELMELYSNAYFGSFNMIYPVLDRQDFEVGILPGVISQGFAYGSLKSVVALLVFALGMVAYEGANGKPIAPGSGVRGGTSTTPPALELFNEARRRVGFVVSSCSLENSQAMLLMAVYYESSCRHTDFWRMAVTAADALRAILRLESEWDRHAVDMIRRTFWTSSIIESWYYLDLNLPHTDGKNLTDTIPLPDFNNRIDFEGQPNVESKYQYNFLSMLSLRGLIYRIFEQLHDATEEGRNEGAKAHHHLIIAELSWQLNTWRSLLPKDLSWDDASRIDCNNRTNGDLPPLLQVDILLAQLRCRYYYARFMLNRPFIWKALHHAMPSQTASSPAPAATVPLSPDILEGFVIAIDSMLEWPIAYPPVRDKKRLIPNIFVWTQSFLMFLLVLRAVRDNAELWRLCDRRVGGGRIEASMAVMLDWIADMRRVDGMALWAWRVLSPIYGLPE